jgi:hypothetical protein
MYDVRFVLITFVIGFDRNFEMPRAEQAGKDARGTRKLIVSSLAVARDRMAQGPSLLFCSPHLCHLLELAHLSRRFTRSQARSVRSTERTERKKSPQSKRVRAPYLSSPLFCRRRFS